MIYADLDNALKDGVSEIRVGQTADSFKARLGCRQTPLFVYAKGVGRIFSWVLRRCFTVIFPARERVAPRNIFKAGAGSRER